MFMMDTKVAFLLFLIWPLVIAGAVSPNCCNGKGGGDVEMVNDCQNCASECDCKTEDCEVCEGSEKCCITCCEQKCDCSAFICSSCNAQYSNNCCSNCCSSASKCRASGCSSTKSCNQCACASCGGKQRNGCCNSCCNTTTNRIVQPENQITLPNITIIINHAPIYVNNTPVIKMEQRCGNATVMTNGTHIVYVYAKNSTCNNRTCCSRKVRPECRPMPLPFPPVCPPPVYVPDCSPGCMYKPFPMPIPVPMPAPQAPCAYFQSWPYVHCPQTGCYGFACSPPMVMPPSPPPMAVQGCIPVSAWPFVRCIPGTGSDSMIRYGSPSYQVVGPSGASPDVPFSSTDHSDDFPGAANFGANHQQDQNTSHS